MTDHKFLSLQEAADYAHVTRQAIYVAVKKRGLKGHKACGRWIISREDLDAYRANKYNRESRVIDGEPVFNLDKGQFSVHQVCKVISATLGRPFPKQHLYYLLRTGQIRAFRKGAAWVIEKAEAVALLEKELEKQGLEISQ